MIIVITHDTTMRDYYGSYISDRKPHHDFWQRAEVIDASLHHQGATVRLRQLVGLLQPDEPLCLVGHGNDHGIGDSPEGTWWWSAAAMADLLTDYLPDNYGGSVLMEACCQTVAGLAPRIALRLDGSRLAGLWIYGHQYAVGITDPLPNAMHLGGPYYPGSKAT